jgi:hypothetical protein
LWIGLALPGLRLLPGLNSLGDQSIAISLQSALLGIDDTQSQLSANSVVAARALGLVGNTHLTSSEQLRAAHGDLDAQLAVSAQPAAGDTSPTAPPPVPPTPSAPTTGGHGAPTPPHVPAPHAPKTPNMPKTPEPGPPTPSPPAVPPAVPQGPVLQAISFTSTPPASPFVGVAGYVVSATATSGLPVSFSSAASSSGICLVSGATVQLIGPGLCTIDADQTGNAHFLAAARVQQAFTILTPSRSTQTINFASTPPAGVVVGDPAYAIVVAASSGLPVALSTSAGSAGVCTLVGTHLTLDGSGTCTLRANQAGDGAYLPAAQVSQIFAVSLTRQTIAFTSVPPGSAVVGGAPYTASATATSGLPVVFSVDSSSAGVCTVSGSTVTPVGAGTCLIDANQFGDGTYDVAPQVQQSFTVGAGAPSLSVQSIHFTSVPPSGAVLGGPAYTVSAAASSGLPVTFSVAPASAGVCTLAGATVSLVGVGTCTIDANQSGDASYQSAPQVQQSFSITLAPQTISFTSTPPATALAGDPAYAAAAAATSGLAVTFTADASSAGVCTVSGANVSLVGAGTCTIDANQAGNGAYQAAVQIQQSFTISTPSLSVQSINLTSSAPAGAAVGGPGYTVSATASSGLAVSFSLGAGSAGVCTLAGANVTFVGTGTCTILADQSGNGSYQAAPQVQQSFAVGLSTQSISFTSAPPGSATVGGPTYTVSATASSGLAVTFSAAPSSAGVCTMSGAVVTLVGAGTCTIDANQAGNGTYEAASQVQQSFAVSTPSASTQSIAFTSATPAGATPGGPTYAVTATASSALSVTFSADASSAGVCTISGATVSFVGTGTCTIDANQAGNGSYQAAPQVQQSFPVGLTSQSISFASTPPVGALAGDPDYTISATASSGLVVVFTADPSSVGVCTVTGSTVSLTGSGTCTIDANQAGDGTYQSAPQVQQSFSIGGASTPSVQTINITSTAPGGAVIGGSYTIAATASSGLAVTFTADGSSAGICTVAGSTVTFVGAGTCTIDANQAGNGSYQAAPQVQQSFAISRVAQTITFTSTPPGGATVGGATYTVSGSASSGLAVTFSIAAGSAGVCTLAGSTVSFVGAGTCTIDANQAGNGNYQAATQVQQSFTVVSAAPSPQSISFTSTSPGGAAAGGSTYTVTASASSGLAVSFTADPSSAGVCTVSGATVSFVGSGTCTIDANQAGNGSYQAAPQVQQSFAVGRATQTITFTSAPPGGATAGGPTYSVSASASSGLAVTLTIAPGSAGVCSISGSTISFSGAGTCTVNANQAGNGAYQAAPQAQQSFTVTNPAPSKSVQSITFTSTAPGGAVVGGPTYTVKATASSGLAVSFSLTAGSAGVCSLAGSTVSFVGAGTCTINANQAGNANYFAAPQVQQSFTVALRTQSISFTSSPPGAAVVGGSTYTVAASATSGLAVSFSAAPASAGVCTVTGSTVTMTGAGTCTVDANQAGNGMYQAAPQAQQSFTVSRGPQMITFTSTPPAADKNDPPYTVTATSTSGLVVVFTTDPSSAGVCSVSGSTVSFSGRGTCIVYANQPGNADYLPAPQVQQVFQIKNHTPG